MSTYIEEDIDFSTFPETDGKPMAESGINVELMMDLLLVMRPALRPLGHHVGVSLLMYWNPQDGNDHVVPDVFVALGAGPARRESWKTWEEGKFPEVVIDIAPPGIAEQEIGARVALYGRLGVREYYIFDPIARLDPAFRGYGARGGMLVPTANPSGASITSPLLGLEFRVAGDWLRLIDPQTALPIPTPEEMRAAKAQATIDLEALQAAERERLATEDARRAAEARAAAVALAREEAERELQRLRALLAERGTDDAPAVSGDPDVR